MTRGKLGAACRAMVVVFFATACCFAANVSLGKPATANTNFIGGCGEVFPAFALTDGFLNDTLTGLSCPPGPWSFWLGSDGTGATAVASIDLGSDFSITEFDIQTTHNRGSNDRGTTLFSLYIGDTAVDFSNSATWGTQVINNGSLSWTPCCGPIPIDVFNISASTGRYVTLASLAAQGINGGGAGLNEISVFGTPAAVGGAPEPSALVLAAAGVMLIAGLRTRPASRQGRTLAAGNAGASKPTLN